VTAQKQLVVTYNRSIETILTIGPKLGSSGTLHIGKGFITARNWYQVNAGRQLKIEINIQHWLKMPAKKEPGNVLDQVKHCNY